jgi:predicted GIY-YIG superfamily endonuclease
MSKLTRREIVKKLKEKGMFVEKKVTTKTLLKILNDDIEYDDDSKKVPKGRYILSFNLKVIIKDRGYKTKKVTKEVTVKDDETEQELVNKYTMEFVEKNYNNSEVDVVGKENIKFTPVTNATLAEVRNRDATRLQYKIFPDDTMINKTKGQCVIDLVVVEMQSFYSKYTRGMFIEQMEALAEPCDEGFVEKGITVRHLKAWAKTQKKVTMFALDPMMNVFDYHVSQKTEVRIMCAVNNEHVYPVRNEEFKNEISKTKKLNFQAPLLQHGNEDSEYSLEENALNATAKVIHVETEDLSEVLVKVIETTGYNCVGISLKGSFVTSFQHPVTEQIFIASEDYLLRRDMAETLLKETNYIGFIWKNQSWAMLWDLWLESNKIKVPVSYYNRQTLDIHKAYPQGGYIGITREPLQDEIPLIKSFDMDKCYSSCLMDNKDPFIIEALLDEIEEFHGDKIPIGKAYLSKTVMLGAQKHSRGWYPSFFVEFLIQNGKAIEGSELSIKDVLYVQQASHTLKPDIFTNITKKLLELCPKAKKAINAGVGAYGRRFRKTGSVAITDSVDVAFSMINNDHSIELTETGKFWFLRKESKQLLFNGNVALRTHIVCMGHIKLFEMEQKICDEQSEVICINTDSIKVLNPRKDFIPVDKKQAKPGDICVEPTVNIRGNIIGNMEEKMRYIMPNSTFDRIQRYEIDLEPTGFVALGAPGFGKSYLLKSIYDKSSEYKCAKWTWTKTAALNIGGETLDHVFPKEQKQDWIKTGLSYDVIQVDEFCMLDPKWFGLFMQIKMKKPELIFQFYGDPNQLHSMEDKSTNNMWYQYENSALMHFLVDGNKLQLEYVSEAARYDNDLKCKLDIFENDKVLSCFGDKRLFLPIECDFNIVKNWQKRDEINKEWAEYYSKGKDVIKFGDKKYWAGMYLISHSNYKQIINSVRYLVTEICPLLELEDLDGNVIELSYNEADTYMRYGYADTVMRMQSRTIHGKFNIHELSSMNWNEVFVALSRAKNADNIGIEYTDKKYAMAVPPKKGSVHDTKLELFTGTIYERTDGDMIYIGSTNNLERRKKEHDEKPVSKKVKIWESKMKHKIITNIVATYICCNKRQLVDLEYTFIAKIPADKCMNTNGVSAKAVEKNTTKLIKPEEIHYSRFKITERKQRKVYRIQWKIKNTKHEKCFSYSSKSKDEAMEEAVKFREELVRENFM